MLFWDKIIHIGKGLTIVVPYVVEHKPDAPTECQAILFEKQGMTYTDDTEANKLTRATLLRI